MVHRKMLGGEANHWLGHVSATGRTGTRRPVGLLPQIAVAALSCLLAAGAAWGVADSAWAQAEANTAADDAAGSGQAAPAAPAAKTPTESSTDAAQPTSTIAAKKIAVVIALFVVPLVVGPWLGTRFRLPSHGWKFSLAVFTLAAAAVVVATGELKLGPDLSGGITLIYELENANVQGAANLGEETSDTETPPGDAPLPDVDTQRSGANPRAGVNRDQLVEQLIKALGERVDPSGTKEVTIRRYGEGQIEIIIPKAGEQELAYIQRRISTAGALEFRITASPQFARHKTIIDLAERLPPGNNIVTLNDQEVARWVPYDVKEFGPPGDADSPIVKRKNVSDPQALIVTDDGLNVTGEFLRSAAPGIDETGRPQVNFTFNAQGAQRFGQLTGNHSPNPSGQKYSLGILLDGKLLQAPSIKERIGSQGNISGGSMTEDDVNFVVGILNAGSLPASLNKAPISSANISPTLGKETIEKGTFAVIVSMAAVTIFMLIYYRFAGIVACLALAANLLLLLAVMIAIKGAFTLPGLAGLALTVGMSVDANVLIFERIREELGRGAKLRMAIRNGFDRATQTIIDSNLTTLLVAVVIYKLAPDNIKGFGVTLFLGIIVSMYSAIFLSRLALDAAERIGWIQTLHMSRFIGETSFNFIKTGGKAIALSLVLIAVGIAAMAARGRDMFNIDFTGGSSVTMVLDQAHAKPYSQVKSLIDSKTELGDKNLTLVEMGTNNSRYTVTTVNQDVADVQNQLVKAFKSELQTYRVQVDGPTAISSETPSPSPSSDSATSNVVDRFAGGAAATLKFDAQSGATGDSSDDLGGVGYELLSQMVQDSLQAVGQGGVAYQISNPEYKPGTERRFSEWGVKLAVAGENAQKALDHLQASINDQPIFPLSNKIGGRVAGRMTGDAIAATVFCLLGITVYMWFRFHKVIYGVAAVVALIHDVLIVLGSVAVSSYFVGGAEPLANLLMVDKFQLSLTLVAALLTVVGYSINDTIVIFDRIREVKGKSPKLTAEMINLAVNQTLGRTFLTTFTTLLTVLILYVWGGEGIHDFAYSLIFGLIAGTYSTVYIASPVLLWLSQRSDAAAAGTGARAA